MSEFNDTEQPTNVFQILAGGKANDDTPAATESATKLNEYRIIDVGGNEHYADGFLIFTSQHVAVMQDGPDGAALPVLVMPLTEVRRAELVEDDEVF